MKIDRGKLKKSSSEVSSRLPTKSPFRPTKQNRDQFQVPADCRSLIEELKGSTQTEFLHKLRGIETWTYGTYEHYYHVHPFSGYCSAVLNVSWTCICITPIFLLQNRYVQGSTTIFFSKDACHYASSVTQYF